MTIPLACIVPRVTSTDAKAAISKSNVQSEQINLDQVLTMEILVRSAVRAEQDAVIGVVIAAFLTDPIARWMYPEAHQYFAIAGSFTGAFAEIPSPMEVSSGSPHHGYLNR
jgi:hypothetical protein